MKDVVVECKQSDASHFFEAGNFYNAKLFKNGCMSVTDKYGVAHRTDSKKNIPCWVHISGREILGFVTFEVQEDEASTF
ncbi:hypothetical protein NIAMH_9 [Serratia phage vB_SmaS_Niamh]|uniref:Uncharacterized protein n=1 Tax=Serratia phage vB_SmaS_Ulliraptor TaxID=2902694 RepID=A0AC61TNY5_9CAUD|nr:hypothetical protein QJS27_gp09 [Serratia phage vB_SmaS_Ulliraptor]QPX74415.1 hypothetical protein SERRATIANATOR_59 [Serratia phage vB_SmaS_Serratianator]UGO52001.1 hypothetical protein ULLIRAPTOR_9 [Serratia phage vB_SmaS_Ulliraptor]UGO52963.1 hypothetical protein NIAMH_9 [Serratia phage vB_SmaS_Niamh]